jgi:uncharacterized protein
MIAGIDYGSKLAGTTVIAWQEQDRVHFRGSVKNQDADAMILAWAAKHMPSLIMLDAPLSLPAVYRGMAGFSDYFYRQADQQLRAMSPMFLGGLTARAMKLKAELTGMKVDVRECYPREVCRLEGWRGVYGKAQKEPVEPFIALLLEKMALHLTEPPHLSWHHADALLALRSAQRLQSGHIQAFGDEKEGQIWI